MSELSKLKYSRLRDYFENERFMRLSRKKEPFEFLLTMDKADSVQALVSAYNDIYIWLASIMLNEIPGLLLKNWWKTYRLDFYEENYLFDDLSQCFNENILRLFKEIQEPTKDDVIYYLANLREGPSVQNAQEKILKIRRIDNKDASYITSSIKRQYEVRRRIEEKGLVYEYREVDLFWYKSNSKILASRKRIFDVAENLFGKENDMSYEKIMAEIKEDEERNRRFQIYQEEEKRKKEEQRNLYERHRQEVKENRKKLFKIIAIMTPFMVALFSLDLYLNNNYPTQIEKVENIGYIILKILFILLGITLLVMKYKEDFFNREKK